MPTNKEFVDLCKISLSWSKEDILKFITNYALKANKSKKYTLYNSLISLINQNSWKSYSNSWINLNVYKNKRIWLSKKYKDQVTTFIEYVKKTHHEHNPFNRILLYGPPWTWKTTLWWYIGHEIWLWINYVKISDIIGSKLWETLQNIDKIFQDSENQIIFLDEFDVYAKNRQDTNDIWELKRTVNSFIQTLDNPEYNKIVIVSTNIISEIDPAIMRRFKFKVHVNYLENEEIKSFLKNYALNDKMLSLESNDIDFIVMLTNFKSLDEITTCVDLARIHKMIKWWSKEITLKDFFESATKEWFVSKDHLKDLKKNNPQESVKLYNYIKTHYWISRFADSLNVHRNTIRSLFA